MATKSITVTLIVFLSVVYGAAQSSVLPDYVRVVLFSKAVGTLTAATNPVVEAEIQRVCREDGFMLCISSPQIRAEDNDARVMRALLLLESKYPSDVSAALTATGLRLTLTDGRIIGAQ